MKSYFSPRSPRFAFFCGVLTTLLYLLGGVGRAQAAVPLQSPADYLAQQQEIAAGREVFVRDCSGCHGINADGLGPAAPMLSPRPRNLVSGSFKFRSTASGTLPTTEDLMRVLDQGVLGTSMPSFRLMSPVQKRALVAYIKSLRSDWNEMAGPAIPMPRPPAEIFSKKGPFLASAARGYQVYKEGCLSCHGDRGLGDGEGGVGLTDGEEQIIKPADYTRPFVKSGRGATDLFRAITTGLDGTPMPGFADVYTAEQRWDMVAYILLRRGQAAGLYPADADLKLEPPAAPKAKAR